MQLVQCQSLKTHFVCEKLGVARTTLWLCQNSYWKLPFIVDLPIKNGDFSIVILIYQRVVPVVPVDFYASPQPMWIIDWVWSSASIGFTKCPDSMVIRNHHLPLAWKIRGCLVFFQQSIPFEWLVGGDWNHGIYGILDFPETIGNGMSSSQLTNSIIFQRGRYTTNQININHH